MLNCQIFYNDKFYTFNFLKLHYKNKTQNDNNKKKTIVEEWLSKLC